MKFECRNIMATRTLPVMVVLLSLSAIQVMAQTSAPNFHLTKITPHLLTTPKFPYAGAQQHPTNQNDRWLEVEVEFAAGPAFTEELTLKYFILLNGRLLTGEVTHAGILAGRGKRSVMYVSPKGIGACLNNAPVSMNSVQNIAVQILRKGAVEDEMSMKRVAAQWYATMTQLTGLVLNKNETPFASVYWDRFEQIKPSAR